MVKRESADHGICVWVLSSAVEHRIADPQVTGSIPVVPSFCGLGGGSDRRPGAMGWESARRVILVGVVGNISACHADARGSIPRRGAFWNGAAPNLGLSVVYLLTIRTKGVISLVVMIERCQRLGRGSIPR